MGFSCGCEDSDYEYVDSLSGVVVYNEHKTRRCCECGCEIAPGHAAHVDVWVEFDSDGPFDDADEERQRELLADAVQNYSCEKCAALTESVVQLGMCFATGELWDSYFDWLREQRKPIKIAPGRTQN